jgi:hypothetical protein
MSFCQYLPKSERKSNIADKPTVNSSFVSIIRTATTGLSNIVDQSPSPSSPLKEKPKLSLADYNIFTIDNFIKSYLLKEVEYLESFKKELSRIIWIADNGEQSDRPIAKNKLIPLRDKILDIESTFKYGLYVLRTADIIEAYRKLNPRQSFMQTKMSENDLENERKKQNIMFRYLSIAREYIDIDYHQKTQLLMCPECNCVDIVEYEDSMYVCKNPECSVRFNILDDTACYRDTERVNMCAKYKYSRKAHFIEAMLKFQGKQNTTIEPQVFEILKSEIRKHNLTTHAGQKNGVTKDSLYMFLIENGLKKYYEDINLLYFMIAGVTPPDISHLESQLLILFNQVDEVEPLVKNPERKNSLNVNFKLYKLLQILDYECRKDDFYILKTPNKEEEHDEKWEEMIHILAQKYPNNKWRLIPT